MGLILLLSIALAVLVLGGAAILFELDRPAAAMWYAIGAMLLAALVLWVMM